jgi:hypothetical protein
MKDENEDGGERTEERRASPVSSARVTSIEEVNKVVLTGMNEFGLENAAGHLNCFLNVILQSMWHLTYTRRFLTLFVQHDLSAIKKIDYEDPPIKPVIEALKVFITLLTI